jgi:pimeloyl-ACP methyl ester carboxylesterase
VLLGLGNNSPGLSELGSRIAQQGVQTTIANYGEWQPLAREAIREYKYDRVRSIMIIGHSLGGSAAAEMAAELGRLGIPVELVVMLDPVGGSAIPYNVRRSVSIRPPVVKIISRSSRRTNGKSSTTCWERKSPVESHDSPKCAPWAPL